MVLHCLAEIQKAFPEGHALPREVGVLRVMQNPLACIPIKKGGAGGAVLKNK